jgi:hypothetical protein
MTRSDVRKLAWTLRLLGAGLLGGALMLMLAGAGRMTSPSSMAAPVAAVKALQAATVPPPGDSR